MMPTTTTDTRRVADTLMHALARHLQPLGDGAHNSST
jgi:hypothetical protein